MDVSRLTPAASRLLNVLLLLGGVVALSAGELMRASGIKKPDTYYAARRELEETGILKREGRPGVIARLSLDVSVGVDVYGSTNEGERAERASPSEDDREIDTEPISGSDLIYLSDRGTRKTALPIPVQGERFTQPIPVQGGKPIPVEGDTPVQRDTPVEGDTPVGWDRWAADADEMPTDDKWNVRNSLANTRRAAQVAALQQAWTHFFPKQPPLTPDSAKDFLRAASDSAEEVVAAFEVTAGKQNVASPIGYVRSVLRNRAEKRKQGPTKFSSPVSTARMGDDGEMREPTASDRAQWDELDSLGLWGNE